MEERRAYIRVPVNLATTLVSGAEQMEVRILNLSEVGLFVMAQQGLPHQAKVSLRLVLGAGDSVCTASGTVVWRTPLGAGIELTEKNETFIDFVSRLVVVANSERAKNELLASLVAPPHLEVVSDDAPTVGGE